MDKRHIDDTGVRQIVRNKNTANGYRRRDNVLGGRFKIERNFIACFKRKFFRSIGINKAALRLGKIHSAFFKHSARV